MFGRRDGLTDQLAASRADQLTVAKLLVDARSAGQTPGVKPSDTKPSLSVVPTAKPSEEKTNEYYDIKRQLFGALLEIIDVSHLTKMDINRARAEIGGVVSEIIAAKKVVMSTAEQRVLLEDI